MPSPPSLYSLLLGACWHVGRRPWSQEGPHDLQEAVELLAPDVVARAGDMHDLELWQLPLHLGGMLWPDDGTAVEVGGDQEGRTGDAWEELLPADPGGRVECRRAGVE